MPPARSATSAARATRSARPRPHARPRRVHAPSAISRIKWDRLFRTVMLVVLALVGYIGVKGMLTLLSTRAEAEQQQAVVRQLARQNRRLEQLQHSLSQPSTIARDARALGMVRAGERSYVITGMPGR